MQKIVSVLISTFIISSQAGGLEVEDFIIRGYTCSLADQTGGSHHQPGVETVCDDGVCSQCVKTAEGIQPWLLRNQHMEVEDYLRHGFVCSLEFRDLADAHKVCDDGLCVGCKKPLWTGGRGQGEVEMFLERGYKCFLVRDVPQYGLAPGVEVVCDDGECFGCINTARAQETARSVDEMVALGYTCSVTRSGEGERGVVCEAGKCYQCQPPSPASQEFPVSARFLDQAEDHLEDGYKCGLTVSPGVRASERARDLVVCEGELCLVCWVGSTQYQSVSVSEVKIVSEASVRKVERLAKRGQRCVVVLGRRSADPGTVCDDQLCFICRN